MKEEKTHKTVTRRSFFKWSSAALLTLPFISKARFAFGDDIGNDDNYWEGPEGSQYAVQKVVKNREPGLDYIKAKVDNAWRKYIVRNVEDLYWNWSFSETIQGYEENIAGIDIPRGAGPHSPMVASYGNKEGRDDSRFHLNNKVIGCYAAPDQDNIQQVCDTMLEMIAQGADMITKYQYLLDIAQQDIWRRDVHVGLEYFTSPDFETHTFLNLMENPIATLCFQGTFNIRKSFEIRCIGQIVDPNNPNVPDELLKLAKYPSILHGFNHGFPPSMFKIGVIYHTIEEYDNSVKMVGNPGLRLVRWFKEKTGIAVV